MVVRPIEFDPVSHTYFREGRVVLNVTKVLGQIVDYSKVNPVTLELARREGVEEHRMVELYSKGDLDEPSLPEWLVPKLAAYKRFLDDTGFEIAASEHRVYHPTYDYAGTADLFGWFGRVKVGRGIARRFACVDLKRSFLAGRAIGFQLAAYANAWSAAGGDPVQMRFALRLLANGEYRLEPFEDPRDFNHFLTCLQFHRLKETLQ